ncbi:cache domain-containing sensor histidine kinase [Paenibacillus montanisoli]|uniref:histidine kinase n=1 Tax=Paenibacillus montanisoli TaxID=2081970 RepID=A0A328TYP0_9BACL|nr:sensor histidine kinase [Paenibacillus montanisoli]RAP74623.1 two-component sensor histidine kinase [Paenibacillus montanisoli]
MSRGFHSIQYRLFVLFLFSMSAIVLIVSILYYNRTTVQFHEKVSGLAKQNVSQTAGLFDLLLKGYDSMSKSVIGNNDLNRILSLSPVDSPAVDYFNERSITNILGAVFLSKEDLIGIHVLTDYGKVYSYGNYGNVIDPDYAKADWYRKVNESPGSMVWLGVFERSIIDQIENQTVFAFARPIFDLNSHKRVGVALFETSPQAIFKAMDNLKLGAHSQVYLMSGEGKLISTTSKAWDEPWLASLEQRPKDGDPVVIEQDKQLIVSTELPYADWTVLSVTPDQDLNVELTETKRFLVLVAAALVLVATILASVFSRTISSPLKRLISEMKQVEIGNFRGSLNVTSYQEINILVASFNQMVNQIAELIERVKISSVSEKNAELKALQSQVNPHFLYNTLDMIYWMLDEKGHDRLGEVVLSLSRLFRYSSHWDEGAVSLREEIEQIEHYLTIIVTRLEGRLTVDIDVAEQWLGIPLPKMTLQPIIENAVKYGLEPLVERSGVLRVYAEADELKLRIMVQDNGAGIEGAALAKLNASLQNPEEAVVHEESKGARHSGGGIGLVNLQRRLRHMYGEAYGVELRSVLNQGTTAIITVPLLPAVKEGGIAGGGEYPHRG